MGRTIIVTGYAKMPEGTVVRALYGNLAIGAIVDFETHTVIEGWASLYAEQTQKFVRDLLVGENLLADDSKFLQAIQADYWGNAQGAICQCYRDMVRRYRERLELEMAGDENDSSTI